MLRKVWFRDACFLLGLLLCVAALLSEPEQAVDAAKTGLSLCAGVIVPSLFPFLIVSALVIRLGMARYLRRFFAPVMGPLFGLSGGCASALALGMIGGYPVGARTAMELCRRGQIGRRETERLLLFCNNCGPAFVFGVVGAGVFSSSRMGLCLYLIHIAASLLIGILARVFLGPVPQEPSSAIQEAKSEPFSRAFTGSITDALEATLHICAFLTCFTVLIRFAFFSGLIPAVSALAARIPGVSSQDAETMLVGMIELSSGVWSLTGSAASLPAQAAMAAFLLGWAGLCVHCQVLSFTGESGLSVRPYLMGKFLHGLVAGALTLLLCRVTPLRQSIAACYLEQVAHLTRQSFPRTLTRCSLLAIGLFLFAGAICYSVQKRTGNRQRNGV